MGSRCVVWWAPVCGWLALGAVCLAAEPASLTPVWTPGQSRSYSYVQRTTERHSAGNMGGRENSQTLDLSAEITLKVLSSGPEGATFELTHQKIVCNIVNAALPEPWRYDSSATDEENQKAPIGAFIQPVLNAPIVLTVSAKGEIESIKADSIVLPEGKQVGAGKQFISVEWVRPRIAPIFGLGAPQGPQPVGTQWSVQASADPYPGLTRLLTLTTSFKLESAEGGVARVSGSSAAQIVPDENTPVHKPVMTRFTHESRAQWDTAAGFLRQWERQSDAQLVFQAGMGVQAVSESQTTISITALP